jgi:cytochrome c peroxidase
MRGRGVFFDPRLSDPKKYPVSARTGSWNKRSSPDLVTSKLAALHLYQLSIPAPAAPAAAFDADAAARGKTVFEGKAKCVRCHVPPLFTEPGWNLHTGREIGIDNFQASRSPDNRYRTAPLRGLWTRIKGAGPGASGPGFYHDGRFADLMAVVRHYDAHFKLGLSQREMEDIVQYLRSL